MKAVGIRIPILVFQFHFDPYPVSILYNSSSSTLWGCVLYARHAESLFPGCNRQDDRSGRRQKSGLKGCQASLFRRDERQSWFRKSWRIHRADSNENYTFPGYEYTLSAYSERRLQKWRTHKGEINGKLPGLTGFIRVMDKRFLLYDPNADDPASPRFYI